MWKNPIAAAIAGVLLGFFAGYLVGQGRPVAPVPAAAPASGNPHVGVPGAPPFADAPAMKAQGGRTGASTDPNLMQQLQDVEGLLAKDPNNYVHLVQMGNVLYDMNNFSRAKEFYEKARAIRDESADVMTDLGVCYRETGQGKQALELFDKAADLQPQHWQSRYNAVVVRVFDLGDLAGAEQELAKLKLLEGKVAGLPDLTGITLEIAKRKK